MDFAMLFLKEGKNKVKSPKINPQWAFRIK